MPHDSRSGYRPDIDGLRALAVLAVILFHANLFRDSERIAPGGFVGVDVFFVISGFLITGLILKGLKDRTFALRDFYARRIRRIFPSLSLVLLGSWVLGWFTLLPDEYRQLGKHIAAGATFVSNFALWREAGYFDTEAQLKPLLHLWSLGIEEQFYIVWPLLVALSWRGGANALLLLIAALGAGSFVYNVALVATDPAGTFYLPFTRFWELLAGGLLAHHVASGRLRPAAGLQNLMAIAGLLLIVLAITRFDGTLVFPGWWVLIPTFGTCLLISSEMAWINRKVLAHPLLVVIGLISYPLYLWHWPLLSFAKVAETEDPSNLLKGLAIGFAFVLAWLSYRLVEKPIRVLKGRKGALALAGLMAVVAALGLSTYASGFPRRFPAEIAGIFNQADATSSYRYEKCFLAPPAQTESDFASDCVVAGNRLVFLWGDSHAAHLYPGIKRLQRERDFGLAQFTAASCVPFVKPDSFNGDTCRRINQFVEQKVSELRPPVVVLSARWPLNAPDLAQLLQRTVSFLRAQGVHDIYLFGPPPKWSPTLRSVMARYYLERGSIPEWMTPAPKSFAQTSYLDSLMREMAAKTGVTYISLIDTLCRDGKCIVRRPSSNDLIVADYDHFTPAGSEYLFEQLVSRLAF